MTDLCIYLDWDSAFFRRRIARVTVSRLTRTQANQVMAWCEAERIDCLYFLADSDDAETVHIVEAQSFAFVDVRLTLQRQGMPVTSESSLRLAQAEDIPILKEMARTNHRDTRFYYDGHFGQAECDALYETWIERSYAGYADVVLIAERDGQPAGYISCKVHEQTGQIGLLGVDSAARGQRIGHALIQGALHWFDEHKIDRVQVVTQGRNVRAQRAYQRASFVTTEFQLWYHRWFQQEINEKS